MLQVNENDSIFATTCCADSSPVLPVTPYRFLAHNVASKIRINNLDDC